MHFVVQLVVRTDRYTFYRIPVDQATKGKLILTVSPVDPVEEPDVTDSPSGVRVGKAGGFSELQNQYGRGVYTADSLVSSGVFPGSEDGEGGGRSLQAMIESQLSQSSMRASLYGGGGGGADSGSGGGAVMPATLSRHQLQTVLDSLPLCRAKVVNLSLSLSL